MAVTLAQAAVLERKKLRRGVLQTFVMESNVLDRMPLLNIQGNSFAYNMEQTLPGVAFRGVNEAYTESTGTFNQAAESITILGGDADVDRFLIKTMSDDEDQEAIQIAMKIRAMSYRFQEQFFNGDISVTPRGFDGLRKRLVGKQVQDANGVSAAGDTLDFLDALDVAVASVKGINANNGAIYMTTGLQQAWTSGLRRLGGTAGQVEWITEDMTRKRVPLWNGIPVLNPGQGLHDGGGVPHDVITSTEGPDEDTESVYVVKYGQDIADGGVTGLTNGGVQVDRLGQLQEKPANRTRLEFYCGFGVFSGTAAARVYNVKRRG